MLFCHLYDFLNRFAVDAPEKLFHLLWIFGNFYKVHQRQLFFVDAFDGNFLQSLAELNLFLMSEVFEHFGRAFFRLVDIVGGRTASCQ